MNPYGILSPIFIFPSIPFGDRRFNSGHDGTGGLGFWPEFICRGPRIWGRPAGRLYGAGCGTGLMFMRPYSATWMSRYALGSPRTATFMSRPSHLPQSSLDNEKQHTAHVRTGTGSSQALYRHQHSRKPAGQTLIRCSVSPASKLSITDLRVCRSTMSTQRFAPFCHCRRISSGAESSTLNSPSKAGCVLR